MPYNQILNTLLKRIPAERSGLAADVKDAFGIVTNFRAKVKEIAADPHLSREGKLARAAEALKGGPADHLKQIADRTRGAKAAIEARRANLRITKPLEDSTLGEMRRAEMRAFLRSLSESERLKLAFSGDAMIEDAIAHGHAALSGLTDAMKGRIVDRIVEASAGEKLSTLAAEEAALDKAAAAIQVAEQFLAKAATEVG